MSTRRITIHRALAELKLIDAKLQKNINEIVPAGVHQKDKLVMGYITQDEFSKKVKSSYDSTIELIKNKLAIKKAIVESNSKAIVKIADKEMTVADAITFKGIVEYKKALANRLNGMHKAAVADLTKNNNIVEGNCQKLLEATFGKDNVKSGNTDVENVRKPFMDANQFHLYDPISATEKAENLLKEVADFESEVDSVLSESNATTFIEI